MAFKPVIVDWSNVKDNPSQADVVVHHNDVYEPGHVNYSSLTYHVQGNMGDSQCVIFCVGLPASGKSTYARALTEKNTNFVRVNKDDLRLELHNGVWSRANEKEVVTEWKTRITMALAAGKSVVVDDTNFTLKWRNWLTDIARQYKVPSFEVRFTNVPFDECIRRDAKREGLAKVGREVIERMWLENIHPAIATRQVPEKKYVILDIDGTLAQCNGRDVFDDSAVFSDQPNNNLIYISNVLADTGVHVIVFSGRGEQTRPQTERWLDFAGVKHEGLYMRSEGDSRPDYVIKQELFNVAVQDLEGFCAENILIAFDDRNGVVDGHRARGYQVAQVAYGNF